jgi:hypothetical protein
VQRYARGWLLDPVTTTVGTFVPWSCAAGEACQFDWSHALVLINGTTGDGEGRACVAVPQLNAVRVGGSTTFCSGSVPL